MISYWDFQEHGMQVIKRTPLYFAQQGHKVTFMVHSETTEKPALIKDLHPNVRILRFNLTLKCIERIPKLRRIKQLSFFGVLCIFNALKMYRDGKKPSVIYAAESDAVLTGCILRWLYKAPLVTRFYGVSRITAYFDSERKKLNRIGLRHIGSRLALTRKADMIVITNDGSNGLELVRVINRRVKNVKFWRNGIDKKFVSSSNVSSLCEFHGIRPEDFVLLTVCRLDPMKRVDRAIRALNYLQKAGVMNSKLVVVGHGSECLSLEGLASKLGIEQSVLFVGAVEHDRIYEYYALGDVFLSLYDSSNVGNPLLEALNSGKCIVSLNTGSTDEVIRDGINGILLEVGDDEIDLAKRLAAVLKELYMNPELLIRLTNGAKAYSKQHQWTWNERLKVELDSIVNL